MKIVVTGVAAPGGAVVRRLLGLYGHHTIGMDADGWPDADWVVSPEAGPELGPWIALYRPDVVLSTVDAEMDWLDGLPAVVGGPEARKKCLDKAWFGDIMFAAGVPHPGVGADGPWIVKPVDGRGTRGTHRCSTWKAVRGAIEINAAAGWVSIIQDEAPGVEWNAEGYVTRDGAMVGLVTYWRWKHSGGFTLRGEAFAWPEVDDIILRAVDAVGLTGPFNAQGFADQATRADPGVIIEINPRMSPSVAMAQACGQDLLGCYITEAVGGRPDVQRTRRTGVRYTRAFYENWTVNGEPALVTPPASSPAAVASR